MRQTTLNRAAKISLLLPVRITRRFPVFFRLFLLFLSVLLLLFLTGCASLLERRYVTSEPHSSKFWESEAAGTLRAENHQDIVNDLLVLIEQHTENATLRLYHYDDEQTVAGALESAAIETQQETPLVAYAVSYITSTSQAQRGYYEVKLQIGYRRTEEELSAIVNATSAEAVYSLLRAAWTAGRESLAIRIGYWGADSAAQVEEALKRLRADRQEKEAEENAADTDIIEENAEGTDTAEESAAAEDTAGEDAARESVWPLVRYYPENGPVGLMEFLLTDSPEESTEDIAADSPAESTENISAEIFQ